MVLGLVVFWWTADSCAAFLKVKDGSEIDRYPYLVSIQPYSMNKHVCGGVLVDKDVIATAAHCVYQGAGDKPASTPPVVIGGYLQTNKSESSGEV